MLYILNCISIAAFILFFGACSKSKGQKNSIQMTDAWYSQLIGGNKNLDFSTTKNHEVIVSFENPTFQRTDKLVIKTWPRNGVLENCLNSECVYRPKNDFVGDDEFSYEIRRDGDILVVKGNVHVKITEDKNVGVNLDLVDSDGDFIPDSEDEHPDVADIPKLTLSLAAEKDALTWPLQGSTSNVYLKKSQRPNSISYALALKSLESFYGANQDNWGIAQNYLAEFNQLLDSKEILSPQVEQNIREFISVNKNNLSDDASISLPLLIQTEDVPKNLSKVLDIRFSLHLANQSKLKRQVVTGLSVLNKSFPIEMSQMDQKQYFNVTHSISNEYLANILDSSLSVLGEIDFFKLEYETRKSGKFSFTYPELMGSVKRKCLEIVIVKENSVVKKFIAKKNTLEQTFASSGISLSLDSSNNIKSFEGISNELMPPYDWQILATQSSNRSLVVSFPQISNVIENFANIKKMIIVASKVKDVVSTALSEKVISNFKTEIPLGFTLAKGNSLLFEISNVSKYGDLIRSDKRNVYFSGEFIKSNNCMLATRTVQNIGAGQGEVLQNTKEYLQGLSLKLGNGKIYPIDDSSVATLIEDVHSKKVFVKISLEKLFPTQEGLLAISLVSGAKESWENTGYTGEVQGGADLAYCKQIAKALVDPASGGVCRYLHYAESERWITSLGSSGELSYPPRFECGLSSCTDGLDCSHNAAIGVAGRCAFDPDSMPGEYRVKMCSSFHDLVVAAMGDADKGELPQKSKAVLTSFMRDIKFSLIRE